jgi:hypothetical protein
MPTLPMLGDKGVRVGPTAGLGELGAPAAPPMGPPLPRPADAMVAIGLFCCAPAAAALWQKGGWEVSIMSLASLGGARERQPGR